MRERIILSNLDLCFLAVIIMVGFQKYFLLYVMSKSKELTIIWPKQLLQERDILILGVREDWLGNRCINNCVTKKGKELFPWLILALYNLF